MVDTGFACRLNGLDKVPRRAARSLSAHVDEEKVVKISVVVLAAGLPFLASGALAQPVSDIGKAEYQSNCASCHGVSGKGDGPVAPSLAVKPSNLTTLAKKNGGVFPTQRVFEIIDGRQDVKAHGPRTMPVWGKEFQKNVPSLYVPQPGGAIYSRNYRNAIVNAKIISLVDYLYRIQAK
jgi:mono/diheme cytochrome c family protein